MNLSENLESKCYSFIHRDSLLIRLAYLFTALADTDWCLLLGQVESSETQRETPGQHRAHPELWVLTSTYCKWYLPQLPATALGTNRMGRTSLPWRTWPLAPPTFTPFSFFFFQGKGTKNLCIVSWVSVAPQKLSLLTQHLQKCLGFPRGSAVWAREPVLW